MQPFTYDKIVLFGDSLTQGCFETGYDFNFGGNLQNHFIRRLDVLNRGYNGYNTTWAKCILPRIIETENTEYSKIKLITIFLGTNDARNTIQRVQLDEYESNLSEMIQLVQKHDINIIVIGPALYDAKLAKESGISTNKQYLEYSKAAKKVAEANNVPFIDLWNAFKNATTYTEEEILSDTCNLENLLYDGIHFNGNGYKVLFKELMKKIEQFPDLAEKKLPVRLTLYKEIDPNDIENSIFKDEL